MSKHLLHRRVQGSRLVNNYGKFETLAALLEQHPRSLKLEALFSTHDSGWTGAAAFHTACDHKGPTLVLIECQDGASYGGYTSISWTSNNGSQTDTEAFLFRIANFTSCHKKQASQKFARTGAGDDIFSSLGYGPTFGGGEDLLTFTTSAGLSLSCNAYSYSTSGPLIPDTVPRYNCHMEVLLVSTDASGSAEDLEAPWQTDCSWAVQVECRHSNAVSISLLLKTLLSSYCISEHGACRQFSSCTRKEHQLAARFAIQFVYQSLTDFFAGFNNPAERNL
jgi:hypothetical protein